MSNDIAIAAAIEGAFWKDDPGGKPYCRASATEQQRVWPGCAAAPISHKEIWKA